MNALRILVALVVFPMLGCNAGISGDGSGRYLADRRHLSTMLADKLIELGQAPAAARTLLVDKLSGADFELELASDGTFTAVQTILNDRRTYASTWTLTGTRFVLDQTHDNGQELADKMEGTLVNGKLDLLHHSKDGEMRFLLYHESSPSAPPR